MTLNQRALRRYALALYSVSSRISDPERVAEDLRLIRVTLDENANLRDALLRSVTPDSAKRRVLERLFGQRVETVTLQFLFLLVDKRRENLIPDLEAAYRKVADERKGVLRAILTSAIELTDADLARAKKVLEGWTGKQVEIDTQLNPDILGGLVIRVGDRLIDGSVKGQISQLKKSLAGTV